MSNKESYRINDVKQNVFYLLNEYGIIFVFIIICMVLSFVSPSFLTQRNVINILRQTSINGLLSIGMTFVILTGGIDLSVGSIVAFSGVVVASLTSSAFPEKQIPALLAIGIALTAGGLIGSVTGFIVSKFKVAAFVVTLGVMSIARGLTFIYTDGFPIPRLSESFLFFGKGVFMGIPVPVIIFISVFFISWVVLYKTRYGRYVYAVGGSEKSAIVSGIKTKGIIFSVYAISGVLSALSGIILTGRTSAGLPQAGVSYELDAIAAVVIGGTSLAGGQGKLIGTLFGVLIIGVINNGLDISGVSSYYQQVVKGAIIIVAVLLDSFRKSKDA